MKAPSFWYKKHSLISKVLLPISALYFLAGKIRKINAKPYQSKIPVICIGNITAGGAGKTPTCLAILKIIKEANKNANPVFVTRGYGGKEKNVIKVDLKKYSSIDVGDEAILLAQKAPCFVGRDRAKAIKMAEKEASHIIIDDGMQNPFFKPAISIMVIDGKAGFGNEHLIPAGPLRESLKNALSHIDFAILIGDDAHNISNRITKSIFRAHLKPLLQKSFALNPNVLAFAGIGRPEKFYDSCKDAGLSVEKTQSFPDHHVFSFKELQTLEKTAIKDNLQLITTAKDYVRLPKSFQNKVSVLNIELIFDNNKEIKEALNL